ncbi:hypothetical protein BO70DRAFT_137742 [Aspergillus heteromorphus CBS 117.55]|uniref:Uncharacterized protein n=1 Tax=Aspergillus heteromorphus CBS 117.55 TaxID=1448321 RepID=A0A317VAY9_9EURO|nr:uncharacterized protein BO70DRAFT_137742 [Aspergillus heteromorphus CBS 117.55]PWY70421.1 hypothetical protein BO70DRAFT_137742 [Aspergillus heteromorphus CBS 117.55]
MCWPVCLFDELCQFAQLVSRLGRYSRRFCEATLLPFMRPSQLGKSERRSVHRSALLPLPSMYICACLLHTCIRLLLTY